ncbi:MAG TPA: ABC transporter permease [Candidatus Acidoferrum sp.]|jgi:molybdate/tungstate transport system permease protein|nr:ABC transporter permease [Candidatus Acidoferrum sp.]
MVWIKRNSPFVIVSAILGVLMVLFLIIPLLASVGSSLPSLPATFTDARTLNAIFISFYCAFLATAFIFILGVPFAYVVAKYDFHGKRFLDSVIDLPILIPHNAAGLALLLVLAPTSPIGEALGLFGVRFIDTIFGIVVAMAFVSAPFLIRSAQEAFESVGPTMEKTARSLGASSFQVFRHVTFPLAFKGIVTGCLLTWARAVSEFGAVVILAYFPKTAPVYMYDVFEGLGENGGLSAALPIGSLLIILAIIILFGFKLATSKTTKLIH